MKLWPLFTQQPSKLSETSLLCHTITKLATELQCQSESHRKLAEKLLALCEEKDAQIKLVLESRFETHVVMHPPRVPEKQEPDDPQQMVDVTEMGEESATEEVKRSTKAYNEATSDLEKQLDEEFSTILKEHQKAHGVQT